MTDERTCLVTGGASGIGEACVQAFAAAGYRVTLGDVQKEKGEALAAKLGANVTFVSLDVRSEVDFERAVRSILDRCGRLDCLVNNAAIAGVMGPIAAMRQRCKGSMPPPSIATRLRTDEELAKVTTSISPERSRASAGASPGGTTAR